MVGRFARAPALVALALIAGLAGPGPSPAQVRPQSNGIIMVCPSGMFLGVGNTCWPQHPGGPSGSSVARRRSYGAIAIAPDDPTYLGWSSGWASKAEAVDAAMGDCRTDGGRSNQCVLGVWFYDRCAAVAVTGSKGYGVDSAATASQARRRALSLCRKDNPHDPCRIERVVCSP